MSNNNQTSCIVNFDDRIAGHKFTINSKAGIALEYQTGYILKLADGDSRGPREVQFYQRVFNDSQISCILLRKFLPQYHGCVQIDGRLFMRLENVTKDRKCVMDVKIGSITWDKTANEEKIKSEKSKYQYGFELGFRILAFKAEQDENVAILTKEQSKMCTSTQIIGKLSQFLSPSRDYKTKRTRQFAFECQLAEIILFARKQKIYQFISSSLLLCYDPKDKFNQNKSCKITLIDFAHTYPSDECDENFLNGLESFMKHFSQA